MSNLLLMQICRHTLRVHCERKILYARCKCPVDGLQVQYGALAVIFLITGLTLSTQVLYSQFKHYHLHLFTQLFSLVLFPTVVFIVLSIIQAAHDQTVDKYILVGLMVLGVLPTTVASNITMTRGANGNVEAATAEVVIGQFSSAQNSPS